VTVGQEEWVCLLCAHNGNGASLAKIALDVYEPPKKSKPPLEYVAIDILDVSDTSRCRFIWDALDSYKMGQHCNYVKGHYYAVARMLESCDPFFKASIQGWTLSKYIKGGYKPKHMLSQE
jgi:hypothetical protein